MPYTTATLVEKQAPGPDGRVALIVEFTGAGEPTKREGYTLDGTTTILGLRAWARAKALSLESKTIADQLTVGMSVNLASIAPPAPTAEEIWRAKVARYLQAKELGATNSTAIADRDALFADINATYQTAYL